MKSKLVSGSACLLLSFPFFTKAATNDKDECRSCFQLAESFESAVEKESENPKYQRSTGSRVSEEGKPIFPSKDREAIFYSILEHVCDGNDLKTECFAVLDKYEQQIHQWFIEGRLTTPFVDAICRNLIPNCTNPDETYSQGSNDEQADLEDVSDQEHNASAEEDVEEKVSDQRSDNVDQLKKKTSEFVKLAEDKVGATFKKAEEKVKNLMDTNVVESLKQVERTFLSKLDTVIEEIRKYTAQVSETVQSRGAAFAKNAKHLGKQVSHRITGRPLTQVHWWEKAIDWAVANWYLVAMIVSVLVLIPSICLFKCAWCRSSAAPARRLRSDSAPKTATTTATTSTTGAHHRTARRAKATSDEE